MNRIVTFLTLCFVAIAAMAQNKAEIIVSYDYCSPTKTGKIKTQKMTLLASPAEAKYYNITSQWVDSLKSTPGGEAKYEDIMEKACKTIEPDGSTVWNLSKGPNKDIFSYVFTNPGEESVTVYDQYGEDLGVYTEPMSEIQWTIIGDSVASVLGYECILAESDYHGRHWKAWFTPEVPMPYGPWKLRGLPGLILKAEANGGFSFTATGIENSTNEIQPMYFVKDYQTVKRKKALASAEYYSNNTEAIMNAQGMRVKMYMVDDNGNQIEIPAYDGLKHGIEPDYKQK